MNKQKLAFVLVCFLLAAGILPAYAAADPLDEWVPRNSAPGNDLNAVTYASGKFVAVGAGKILTSDDGAAWIQLQYAYAKDIAYGNGMFVAIWLKGDSLRSPDGISWVYSRPPGHYGGSTMYEPDWYLNAVTYGNGKFVAIGKRKYWFWDEPSYEVNYVLTSADGEDWNMKEDSGGDAFLDLAYGNGKFVRVGNGGAIQNSADGISWTNSESGTSKTLTGVAYVNGRFMAVGESGTILTSDDGNTWTTRQSGTAKNLKAIAYGGGTYAVTGEGGTILTSEGGTNWSVRPSGTTNDLVGIAYGSGTFVAVGKAGTILQSSKVSATDNIPPVTKYSVKPIWASEGGKTYIKGYTVTLTATDNSSGVKSTWYRINGGAWHVYTAPFTLYGTSSTSLDFYSEDNAGNKEKVS